MLARQTAHTFTFRTHHQCQTSGHFALVQGMICLTRGTDDPDILFLQQTHGTRQVGYADQRNVFRCAAGHFLRCRVQLRGAIFRYNHSMHTCRIRATQACAEIVRIGYAIKDQEERVIQCGNKIRQIVFLILTARLHARNNALVDRAFTFLIQVLTVRQLDHHALRFQRVDQRHQTFVFTPFQNKHFLKTLRCALEKGLHRVDAVNHFTH